MDFTEISGARLVVLTRRASVSLEVTDPLRFDLTAVRKLLRMKPGDPMIVEVEVDQESELGRFVFKGGEWPKDMVGDQGLPLELRDKWKDPSLFYATEWLQQQPRTPFDKIREQDLSAALVIRGYRGTIPQALLLEVVRLGLELDVLE